MASSRKRAMAGAEPGKPSAIEVSAVPPDGIQFIKDQVLGQLAPVSRYTNGRYLAEDMVRLCEAGSSALFIAFEPDGAERVDVMGAVVVALNQYPRRKVLFVQFVGGDRTRLWRQNMYELLKRFALDNGCDGIEGVGRIGWLRWFPMFTPIAIMGEIDLVGGRGQLRTKPADSHSD